LGAPPGSYAPPEGFDRLLHIEAVATDSKWEGAIIGACALTLYGNPVRHVARFAVDVGCELNFRWGVDGAGPPTIRGFAEGRETTAAEGGDAEPAAVVVDHAFMWPFTECVADAAGMSRCCCSPDTALLDRSGQVVVGFDTSVAAAELAPLCDASANPGVYSDGDVTAVVFGCGRERGGANSTAPTTMPPTDTHVARRATSGSAVAATVVVVGLLGLGVAAAAVAIIVRRSRRGATKPCSVLEMAVVTSSRDTFLKSFGHTVPGLDNGGSGALSAMDAQFNAKLVPATALQLGSRLGRRADGEGALFFAAVALPTSAHARRRSATDAGTADKRLSDDAHVGSSGRLDGHVPGSMGGYGFTRAAPNGSRAPREIAAAAVVEGQVARLVAADQAEVMLVEARLLCTLQHRNIATVTAVVLSPLRFAANAAANGTPSTAAASHPALYASVSPHMQNGDLRTFLKACRPMAATQRQVVGKPELLAIAAAVLAAMAYLEEKKVVHRALMAEHVLVGADHRDIRLAGFGSVRAVFASDEYVSHVRPFAATGPMGTVGKAQWATALSPGGTRKEGAPNRPSDRIGRANRLPIAWLAPECYEAGVFTTKSDVWAAAVLVWEITSHGRWPFGALSAAEVGAEVAAARHLERFVFYPPIRLKPTPQTDAPNPPPPRVTLSVHTNALCLATLQTHALCLATLQFRA
jgi:hypothetical protein